MLGSPYKTAIFDFPGLSMQLMHLLIIQAFINKYFLAKREVDLFPLSLLFFLKRLPTSCF